MANQTAFRKRLKVLMNRPENQVCSDCPERQPRWASLIKPPPGSPPGSNIIGCFCCLECSGSHRRLGVHISFVRSITLDQWKEEEVLAMENGGNQKVNAIFEANLNNKSLKPTAHANGQTRERFIRDKYERKKFYDAEVYRRYNDGQLGAESESESESDSDDDSEDGHNHRQVGYGDVRRRNVPVTRAPSEVARQRAEKIRQRQGGGGGGGLAAVKRAPAQTKQQVRQTTAPAVDLLNFEDLTVADPIAGPPPNPPSATTSPKLDLFDNPGNPAPSQQQQRKNPEQHQQQQQQQGKMSKDDILAMFQTPMTSTQQQPQRMQQTGNYAFGGGSSNNTSPTAAFGNGNPNPAMMQNHMMMNGNSFAANPNNNMMMMMMMNKQGGNMMPNQMMMQNQMMMNGMNPNMMQYQMGLPNSMGSMNNVSSNLHQQQQQQQQQQQAEMTPMGGTPSNLTVMGGVNTGNAGAGVGNQSVVVDGNNGSSADPFEQFGAFRSY